MVKVAAYRLKYIHLQIYNCLLEEAIILSKSRGLPITINKDSIILQIRKCIKFPVPMIHRLQAVTQPSTAESTLLPLFINLAELFYCHVCHIRDELKYRAKVRTKTQADNTGFTDSLPCKHSNSDTVLNSLKKNY